MSKPMTPDPRKGKYWGEAWYLAHGCKRVKIPGAPSECDHCWAAAQTHMRAHNPHPIVRARHEGLTDAEGRFTGEVRIQRDQLDKPVRRRKPTIWSVWNDLFHEKVPREFIVQAFARMYEAGRYQTILVLTKRPERMAALLNDRFREDVSVEYASQFKPDLSRVNREIEWCFGDWPFTNVWAGTTVGTQAALKERAGPLVRTPAGGHFFSMEPLLEAVNLLPVLADSQCTQCGWLGFTDNSQSEGGLERRYGGNEDQDGYWACPACGAPEEGHVIDYQGPRYNQTGEDFTLDWIIAGGETGPGARAMQREWIRGVRDQANMAGVPFWFKSWGDGDRSRCLACGLDKSVHTFVSSTCPEFVPTKGRLLDGREWNDMPPALKLSHRLTRRNTDEYEAGKSDE